MPIEKINSLRNYGIFRDFRWPNELTPFSDYNLIYGYNWSGKSTISNLLRAVEKNSTNHLGDFRITIDSNIITSDPSNNSSHNIKVFNKSFIEDSVFPATSDEISGIYNIGEENVAIARKIGQLQIELNQIEQSLAEIRVLLNKENQNRNDHGTNWARLIRNGFLTFGLTGYNNYQRPNLFEDMDLIVDNGQTITSLNETKLQSYQSILNAEQLNTVDLVPRDQLNVKNLIKTTSSLLKETPAGSFSARITNDPTVADWIASGFKLHQEHSQAHCLYCDQAIPNEVISELNDHFNAEVEHLLARIDTKIDEIEKSIEGIETFTPPDENRIYANLRQQYASKKLKFENERSATVATLNALVKSMNSKKSTVDASMTADRVETGTALSATRQLNRTIEKQNEVTANFITAQKEAESQLKTHYLAQCIEDYQEYNRKIEDFKTKIAALLPKLPSIQGKIEDLRLKIDNYSLAATNLTADLREYLGHSDLQISVQDDSYVITRSGIVASNLSEGEKSAVALLYFLHSLSADEIDTAQIAVVLDDPVTSMDTNSMINAVSFIRNRIPVVGQILVLTHDFNFTKEVIKWFRGESQPDERNFYMINVTHDNDSRRSSIAEMDPTLVRFDSEYHYMFDQTRQCAQQNQQDQLFVHHHMPNLLRRVIETFVAFKFPSAINTTTKFRRLRRSGFSESKIDAIESFTNSFSHGIDAGGQEPDQFRYPLTPQYAQDVLDLIEHIDPDHYRDMCDAIANADRNRQNH